jgi:hypothetical protein
MLSFSIINLLIGDHISGVDILVFDNCVFFLSATYEERSIRIRFLSTLRFGSG